MKLPSLSTAGSKAERRAKARRRNDVFGGEYSVVSLDISWGPISILCFLFTLPVRYWIRWLPVQPEHVWMYPRWTLIAIGLFSATGTLCALIGLFSSEQRTASKIGLITNGLVLFLVCLTVLGIRLIMNR